MSTKQISIIICTYNSNHLILNCVDKIIFSLNNFIRDDFEMIIVNNNSTDNTSIFIEFLIKKYYDYNIINVFESKPGLMYARLKGISSATSDIGIFIDDDNLISINYIPTVIEIFKSNNDIGYIGCRTELPCNKRFDAIIEPFAKSYAVGRLFSQSQILSKGETVWGAGLAIRILPVREIFNSGYVPLLIGRTSDINLAGDDAEIIYILIKLGYLGYYWDNIGLYHDIQPSRQNIGHLTKMYQGFGASAPILLLIYNDFLTIFNYFIIFIYLFIKYSIYLFYNLFLFFLYGRKLKHKILIMYYIYSLNVILNHMDIHKIKNNKSIIKSFKKITNLKL